MGQAADAHARVRRRSCGPILRREEPLEHHGEHYDIPYSGPDATGLGKPLKLIVQPPRPDVPIYLAAIGPKNVALAAEIADGWLPIFFSPERFARCTGRSRGGVRAARRAPRGLGSRGATCRSSSPTTSQAARDFLKPLLALYVGGMGARGQNFYNRLAQRYGYEEAAATVQDLFLDGKKDEAGAAVPDALVDEVALVGDRARIAERVAALRDVRRHEPRAAGAPARGAATARRARRE